MHVLVAVPTVSGIETECALSLWKLHECFGRSGIRADLMVMEFADVAYARNRIAARLLAARQCTHLLFVDADMQFEPASVERMIQAALPLIGCVYPARDSSLRPVVRLGSGQSLSAPMSEVIGLGMGLCLIQREVFEALRDSRQIRHGGEDPPIYHFFTQILSETEYLSEDFAFCHRWTTICSGKIWALANEDIGHVGKFTYRSKC